MMTPTEIEAAPGEAPVEKRGWERLLLGIVLWPRSTFAYLRGHGGRSWILPVLLVALLAVAARAVAIPIEKAQADAAMAALPPQTAGGPAVRLDLPAGLPLVDADPERVGQVLRNLITNAQHHTPPEGTITVSAQAGQTEVEISVSDTGAGIAPEYLPFVFERFYRADQARARSTGGAGLGLAIVKQIVEAHGGHVAANSAPGAGATFRSTLPYAQSLL
jgi:two-component system, OmpR family, sensor histidine kinase BaeS